MSASHQHESAAKSLRILVSILGVGGCYLRADCAEWDGFRGYHCFDARGSWTEIRGCSSTPSGAHACFQDVVCLMCTDAGRRLGSESRIRSPDLSRDTQTSPIFAPNVSSDFCL